MSSDWKHLKLGWNLQPQQVLLALLLGLSPHGANAQSNNASQSDIEKCETNKNPDEAVAACTRLISEGTLSPFNLAIAFANRGAHWYEKRDHNLAIADYDDALRLNPRLAEVHYNRGLAKTHQLDYKSALADYDHALRLNPHFLNAYYDRAILRIHMHDHDGAITDFNEVIRLDPKHTNAHNNCAWMLATTPVASVRNGARALELARKAAELTDWKEAHVLRTLAAAYAETGNFSEAMRWQNKALEFPEITTKSRGESLRQIELYRRGQPYRTASLP